MLNQKCVVFGWETVVVLLLATMMIVLNSTSFYGVVESADLTFFDTLVLDMTISLDTEINRTQPIASFQLAKRSSPTHFPVVNWRHN